MARRKNKQDVPVSPRRSKHRRSSIADEESKQQATDSATEDVNEINVYVRLRPINKQETNNRAKDCVELHDDPALITVDAPHHGLHDFSFDSVFDEYATHQEVYQESSLPEIPHMLLDGIDCTVLAYGQGTTGKSHLIFGTKQSPSKDLGDGQEYEPADIDNESQGVMSRVVEDLFDIVRKHVPSTIECRLRFSMAELYLERWMDLLRPTNPSSSENSIFVDNLSNLKGLSQLCCLQPTDVYRAMVRGSSFRTRSATKQNEDASRSHIILQLDVEQIDRLRGTTQTSRLRVVDFAGSEQANKKSSRELITPLTMEGKMVSASLQSFVHYIKARINQQKYGELSSEPYANVSKLTKYLKSTFTRPCFTTAFLTASPASLSIGDTLSTLQFGSYLRQVTLRPIPRFVPRQISVDEFPEKLRQAESQVVHLTKFVKLLAVECRTVRKTGKIKQPHAVWDIISRIAKTTSEAEEDASDLVIAIHRRGEPHGGETKEDIENLEDSLRDAELERDQAQSLARDYQSELASLRAEKDLILQEKTMAELKLLQMQEEVTEMNHQKHDLEQQLLTSHFRENEAVVFLRQFRSFYSRLLNSKASMGTGSIDLIVNDIIADVEGVANLKKLLDVDSLLLESGLIEKNEIGKDTNDKDYMPSGEASSQSLKQAESAEKKEIEVLEGIGGSRIESGQVTTYRHKLVETPAGKLALERERDLEEQVIELSGRCMGLQNSLNAEKAMVEALTSRQGALGKMKAAQEMNMVRTELERSRSDLQAIVWKMNELHLVNKAIHDKVETREQQLATFNERCADLQVKNKRLAIERQDDERRRLEAENELKKQLHDMSVQIWQLGEKEPAREDYLKLILPASGENFAGEAFNNKAERRISVGDIAEEGIDLLLPPTVDNNEKLPETAEVGMQTDEIILDIDDAEVQTDPTPGVKFPYDLEEEEEIVEETAFKETAAGESSDGSNTSEKTATETVESQMQTEGEIRLVVESQDAIVQTDVELTFDVAIQTDAAEADSADASIAKPLSVDVVETGIQTEFVQIEHTKICFEAGTQTDEPPSDVGLHASNGSMDEEDLKQAPTKRPPKPSRSSDRLLQSTHSGASVSIMHTSVSSLGSLGSFGHSPVPTQEKKWIGQPSGPAAERLGASMSFIQGPASKTTDWRAKLRQKGEDVSHTPTGAGSRPTWTANNSAKGTNHLPKPPIGGFGSSRSMASPSPAQKVHHASFSSDDDTVPEWMSKFREMGIKADENEQEEEEIASSKKSNRGKRNKETVTNNDTPWNLRANPNSLKGGQIERGSSFDGNRSEPVLSEAWETEPTTSGKQPEWMRRFEEIGMKGEEKVIETGPRTIESTASADEDEETASKGEDDNVPEWMRKFKQIKKKRGDETSG